MSAPVSIVNWAALPDSAALGNVFEGSLADIGANDVVCKHGVVMFADTSTKIGLPVRFKVPSDYVGTSALLRLKWTCVATTGNAVWDFDARSIGGNDTESTDQATFDEAATVTDAAPATARNLLDVTMTLTANKYSANEEVQGLLSRDGAAADTIAGTVAVLDAYFEGV